LDSRRHWPDNTQPCGRDVREIVFHNASFFIFLVENEAKNKNEQTKAFPQAILPTFVHPDAQKN
ncbi:MAG: hypothetical protein AAF388_22115, partial [Bacteroidota bacterium]